MQFRAMQMVLSLSKAAPLLYNSSLLYPVSWIHDDKRRNCQAHIVPLCFPQIRKIKNATAEGVEISGDKYEANAEKRFGEKHYGKKG